MYEKHALNIHFKVHVSDAFVVFNIGGKIIFPKICEK